MNVLVVVAHPDDAEIFCGGTIRKYVNKGHRVKIIVCTRGATGSPVLSRDEIAEIRKKEAIESSKVLGAEISFLDYEDGYFSYGAESMERMIDILREFKADIVFTHHPEPYANKEHDVVSRIVSDALQFVFVPNVKTDHSPVKEVPYLYYFETLYGIGFIPEEYVDITEEIDIKKEALSRHRSQFEWMGIDLLDLVTIKARFRGYQCGCKYSEAFACGKIYSKKYLKSLLP